MNDTLKTIGTRYSCRSFTGEAIDRTQAEMIALAAVQAPSGLNQQPWKISILQNKATIDAMDDALMQILATQDDHSAYERIMQRGGKVFYNAPCIMVIAKLPGKELDCGIAVENMALAASSLGLGNVICGMAAVLLNDPTGAKYHDLLVPQGYEFGIALLVGHPTNAQGIPHEPDRSKIMYVD